MKIETVYGGTALLVALMKNLCSPNLALKHIIYGKSSLEKEKSLQTLKACQGESLVYGRFSIN